MKIIIKLILVLCISNYISYSQIWESINLNETIEDFHFFNADIGLALTGANAPYSNKIYKTTNKGINWFVIKDFENSGYNSANMSFVNANTGYVVVGNGTFDLITETRIYKTTNSGNTWAHTATIATIQGYYEMFFTSENVGFYTNILGSTRDLRKTTDGGQTWPVVYQIPSNGNITDIRKSATDPSNTLYISSMHNNKPYLVKYTINSSSAVILANGESDPYLLKTIRKISVVNNNGTDEVKVACYNGIGTYSNNSLVKLSDPPLQIEGLVINYDFSNSNFGLIGNYLKLMSTTNGGATWSEEFNGNTSLSANYSVIGNVAYSGYTSISNGSGILTRKIQENLNTKFDWTTSGSGSMSIDGTNYVTPIQQYVRGGTCVFYTNPYILNGSDTTALFYYWGGNLNGSMNWNNNSSYLINANSQVNADFKTKLKTITGGALSCANQVKALKDTNGVTNLAYESMGGIFFTRTKPGGQFKAEEIISGSMGSSLNGSVTYENSNPYICEINVNPNEYNAEKNVAVCFERREGNNVKIFVARRYLSNNKPEWALTDSILIQDVPLGFKCFPKLFMSNYVENVSYFNKLITYLKPVNGSSSNVKLCATFISILLGGQPERELVPAGNINEYAIQGLLMQPSQSNFILHIAYRIGQTVYYKKCQAGYDPIGFVIYELTPQTNISSDNSRWRASLDIALKNTANSSSTYNMQPVITYQGRYDVRILIENEDGPPIEQAGAYYPIYVKERLSGGGWSSSVISYNAPVNTVQQTPNIEGAKQMNSCILNYTRVDGGSNKNLKVVPRWNNSVPNAYFCEPNSFIGTDAKFIKSGLINNNSSTQKLITLSAAGNIFNLGTQSFNITNTPSGGIDGNLEELSAIVEDNDVKYSFNLGDIMVNNNNIGFSSDIDTAIDNSGDLNSNMVSKTFRLNENDTLIIGRNASYFTDNATNFHEIEYWVKLMNKSNSVMHRLLAHDTLRITDSVQIEFLEGYIIRNIPNGSDSFYVQLEIDTVDGNFGIGGGIGGDGNGSIGGDNVHGKRKIYWENENISNVNNNIPTAFSLYQNFPNPFNPATVIKYDLPKDVKVTVKVYDLLGQEVTILVNNEYKNAGRYEINWNASRYASGVYIYRIEAGDFVETKKMILIK